MPAVLRFKQKEAGFGRLPFAGIIVDRARAQPEKAINAIASAKAGISHFAPLNSVVVRPHRATPKVIPFGMPMPLALS